MSRTIIDESTANFVLGGGGSWSSASAGDQAASYNGTLHTNTNGTAAATITPPSTTTCCILLGCARADGPTAAEIKLDGVHYAYWNLYSGTTAGDNRYYWFRACSPPIFMAAGSSHTITVTNTGTGSTTLALDGAEFYIAESPTASRMTVWGHSWAFGYNPSAPATPLAGRFAALLAARLGLTEDNQGVNSIDLANGVNTSVAITAVQTVTVDATGGTFTLTLINPTTGATLTTGTISGVTTTTAATVQTTIRAVGAPYASVTVAGANGGPYAVTMAGITGYVPLMTANSASLTGGATHTATIAHTTYGQSANPQYNSYSVAIPSWQLAEGYTQSANSGATWARTPALFVGIHGINDLTSWNAYDTVGVGGGPAAGVGWSHARFAQRLREVFWRVKANCPTCELWMLTQAPSDAGDTAANRPVFADINAAIIQACSDPTVNANVADVSLVLGKQNGGATLYGTDDAHPNATGHLLVADAFMAAYRRKHTELYGRTGVAIF